MTSDLYTMLKLADQLCEPSTSDYREPNLRDGACRLCECEVPAGAGVIWMGLDGGHFAIVLCEQCRRFMDRLREMDGQDRLILSERAEALRMERSWTEPGEGDFVVFADGTTRRVSHVWTFGESSVQTSDGGSFYLSTGCISFSGSLFVGLPASTFTRTDQTRPGEVWFFHHNIWGAGRGVDAAMPFPVWACSEPAKRY